MRAGSTSFLVVNWQLGLESSGVYSDYSVTPEPNRTLTPTHQNDIAVSKTPVYTHD